MGKWVPLHPSGIILLIWPQEVWEVGTGLEYHLAASFMVLHCPSFGNEMPLIFFSGCKRNCPSLNIRGPICLVSQHFSLQLFLLFTIGFFQKDFYDTPFTPSCLYLLLSENQLLSLPCHNFCMDMIYYDRMGPEFCMNLQL